MHPADGKARQKRKVSGGKENGKLHDKDFPELGKGESRGSRGKGFSIWTRNFIPGENMLVVLHFVVHRVHVERKVKISRRYR